MKTITKRAAVVLVAILVIQSLFTLTDFGSTAMAKTSKTKTKIVKLKQKIRKYKNRIRLYKVKKRLFINSMNQRKSLLKQLPVGLFRNVVADKRHQFLNRVKGCDDRIEMYKSKMKKTKARIKKLKALASAKQMRGKASWYGGGMREYSMVAAMRGYRGRRVKVTNLSNGKSVVVRINDYGPATWTGRVIDLSKASFARLGSLSSGVLGRVKLEIY